MATLVLSEPQSQIQGVSAPPTPFRGRSGREVMGWGWGGGLVGVLGLDHSWAIIWGCVGGGVAESLPLSFLGV